MVLSHNAAIVRKKVNIFINLKNELGIYIHTYIYNIGLHTQAI